MALFLIFLSQVNNYHFGTLCQVLQKLHRRHSMVSMESFFELRCIDFKFFSSKHFYSSSVNIETVIL